MINSFKAMQGKRVVVFGFVALALGGCEGGNMPAFLTSKSREAQAAVGPMQPSGKTVERDVEAPEAFQVFETGLWDGRPSLGGVWVAHPDVKDPERVIIRNPENGKFVVGALFRRERENPGPRLQVSSDAADALGVLAGQPKELNVTALRRKEVAVAPEAGAANIETPSEVKEEALDPIVGAAAAIDAAEASAKPAVAPAAKPAASTLATPYVQLGIFSVEKNAQNTATAMRTAGMAPTVKKLELNGKTFWRVVVGPARTKADLNHVLKKAKAAGFKDAYAVRN